jgi:hypothetical protein
MKKGLNLFGLFDGSKLQSTPYAKHEISEVDTYEKFVIYTFRKSLFPGMDSLSQPPLNRKVRVDFSDQVGHMGSGNVY